MCYYDYTLFKYFAILKVRKIHKRKSFLRIKDSACVCSMYDTSNRYTKN